jgi:hypothetical protein
LRSPRRGDRKDRPYEVRGGVVCWNRISEFKI